MATQQVVLSRNEKKNRSDAENPFGSTVCYGTNQVIVEVCNRFLNSALSTVFFFFQNRPFSSQRVHSP